MPECLTPGEWATLTPVEWTNEDSPDKDFVREDTRRSNNSDPRSRTGEGSVNYGDRRSPRKARRPYR